MPKQPDIRYGIARSAPYWQLWWYDSSGKRHRRALGRLDEYTERRALRVAAQRVNELIAQNDTGDGVPLSAWVKRYRAMRQGELKPSTLANLDGATKLLLEYFGDNIAITSIRRIDAADFRTYLQQPVKIAGGERTRSPSTVAKLLMWSSQVFGGAHRVDLLPFNPFDRIPTGQPKTDQRWTYIDLPTTAKILAACPSPQWRAAFALARYAGLRRGEIHALHWDDIDLQRRVLTVHGDVTTRTTKARLRRCPITPELAALLEAVKADLPGSPGPWHDVPDKKLTAAAHAIVAAAGVQAYAKPLHTLRKSLETDWIDQYGVADTCEWLGNSPAVALSHYKRATPEAFARVTGVDPKADTTLAPKG